MGEVWLAEHQLLGRKVAVKSLHSQLIRKSSVRTRFMNEGAALARLQHPNIVTLHDYIEDEEGVYLILEYVEGDPMDEYILKKSGPLPAAQLINVFSQILDAFGYAHDQQIVHRDIKPSNIVITKDQKVKILDFGIAKLLDGSGNNLTKTGTAIGTVLYMSPEQVKGGKVDQRSDIYSLGVTLFQLATGKCPYDKETTEFAVYEKIVNQPLPNASDIYPGVPSHLNAVIAKATAKDPKDRFQDCQTFLKALTGKLVVSTPPTPPSISPPPARPNPAPAAQANPIPVAAPSNSPPAPHNSTGSPPPKKRKIWPWIAGGAAAAALALVLVLVLSSSPGKEKLYVIASNLFVRSSPNLSDKTDVMLPYGTEVIVENRNSPGWVETKRNGQKAFLSEDYLVGYKDFQIMDHLCSNPEGKELMRGSYQKFALKDYFTQNGYRVDLPKDVYEEVYEEDYAPEKIWQVTGLSSDREFNTVISAMKLEKTKWKKKENENCVVIIEKKTDPDQRRMVAFRFLDNGVDTEIGSLDMADYPGQNIRSVAYDDLNNHSSIQAWDIRNALKNGKEGILIGRENQSGEQTLLVWKSYGKFDKYTLYRY